MLRAIEQCVLQNGYTVAPLTTTSLVRRLYNEMAMYSFLTEYLIRMDVEEININRWDDVKITYANGQTLPAKEQFRSPDHALDIIRRMLSHSGIVLDNAKPTVVGHLSDKIRITVTGFDIIPSGAGVSASIRIVNPRKLQKDDFLKGQTAKEEMLDFLSLAVRYGASLCVSGATGSGKTTLMSWLCQDIDDADRVYVIENSTHEFELWRRDESGSIANNCVHTISRNHDEAAMRVDQDRLLEIALTMNPDIIIVAEMKSREALAAVEAANTGHAVLTTIHTKSCRSTYSRIVDLCKKAGGNMDSKTLYTQACEAFPLVVYTKKYRDSVRRISEILECEVQPNGEVRMRQLFRFKVTHQARVDGSTQITGHFERVNPISENLALQLTENGMPTDELARWTEDAS